MPRLHSRMRLLQSASVRMQRPTSTSAPFLGPTFRSLNGSNMNRRNLRLCAMIMSFSLPIIADGQSIGPTRDSLALRVLRLSQENDSLRRIIDSMSRPAGVARSPVPTKVATPQTSGRCFETTIMSPTPFMGNNNEIFKIADGSFWEIKFEYEYMYEYYPTVVLCPSTGKLSIKGKSLNIQAIAPATRTSGAQAPNSNQASDVVETKIDGDFTGFEDEKIFKMQNGRIWQQSSYGSRSRSLSSPKVLIYKSGSTYKMRVEGIDAEVSVTRLK